MSSRKRTRDETPAPELFANELITLTFGDMAENHVGMEQIGKKVAQGEGFTLKDLVGIQARLKKHGAAHGFEPKIDMYDLLPESPGVEAHVMVIRGGVDDLWDRALEGVQQSMFHEQRGLTYDKKAFMYGRVVNKYARWNLCFDDASREPDYETGKGRIVGYTDAPHLNSLREKIMHHFGHKAQDLKIESNYYYDVRYCGIGFHGDSERRKVIGVRLGNASLPLHFQWFQHSRPVGERIQIPLNPGDIYVMTEKATGTDWKNRSWLTVRHATGCAKFTAGK
jgi:alkylated DNA repair dioxygenase AlkB